MATAEQLESLIRSHAEGDEAQFLAVAMQVAAKAARQGHVRLAQELRALIDEVKARSPIPAPPTSPTPTPLLQPRGELAGLLSVAHPDTRLTQMVLAPEVERRLHRILQEHRQQDRLAAHGLVPRHRALLVGPPGSGKTMTASALAGELQLPLFTVRLDGLITKFMGETAAKLRLVFDAMRATRGVYLFDEFDAIGGQRTLGNDVGEIRRVLNSFLQFLEQDQPHSLIVAATNHPQLLDEALFRRFDDVITYGLPTPKQAEKVMRARLAPLDTGRINWRSVLAAARGSSHAALARACDDATKDAVLRGARTVSTQALVEALKERRERREA